MKEVKKVESEIGIGSTWKHYKGGTYKVIAVALQTETEEILIVYTDNVGNVFARPVKMWFDTVKTEEGKILARFVRNKLGN